LRLRLNLAVVSLILVGGTAVRAERAALFPVRSVNERVK
jgi:hypothetical protein